MTLTAAEESGVASLGTENTGNPVRVALDWAEFAERPFRASSESTAPAEESVAPAISFTAANMASSISRVVLI
jgi:hypothetical protein